MARVVLIPLTVAVPKSTSEGFARPPWPRPGLGGRPNRLAKAWYGLSSGAGGVGVAVCGWGALRVQPRGSRAIRPSPVLPVQGTSRLPICDKLSKYVGPTRPWDNNHGRGTQSAQLGHGHRTTCTSGAAAERPARFAAVRAPGAHLCVPLQRGFCVGRPFRALPRRTCCCVAHPAASLVWCGHHRGRTRGRAAGSTGRRQLVAPPLEGGAAQD